MKKKIIILSLLLGGCASTTKIPIEGSWFTSNKNYVIVETKEGKEYKVRIKEDWLNLSKCSENDSLTVKKETLPFGLWPVYTWSK